MNADKDWDAIEEILKVFGCELPPTTTSVVITKNVDEPVTVLIKSIHHPYCVVDGNLLRNCQRLELRERNEHEQ